MNFSEFKKKINSIEEWLKKEYSSFRTGKATPVILDSILVESYGSKMKKNQMAGITIEDARTLRISPWDKGQTKEIEKAIIQSSLGLSVNVDDAGLRVIFPELTSERRDSFIKVARQKLEEARISLRKERDTVKNEIESSKKKGEINEDGEFRLKEEMQKIVAAANTSLESITDRKEKEIKL